MAGSEAPPDIDRIAAVVADLMADGQDGGALWSELAVIFGISPLHPSEQRRYAHAAEALLRAESRRPQWMERVLVLRRLTKIANEARRRGEWRAVPKMEALLCAARGMVGLPAAHEDSGDRRVVVQYPRQARLPATRGRPAVVIDLPADLASRAVPSKLVEVPGVGGGPPGGQDAGECGGAGSGGLP